MLLDVECQPPNVSSRSCLAEAWGSWLDALAEKTEVGRWQIFGTITFAPPEHPWCRGFPATPYQPNPDFAHRLFARFISHLEHRLQHPVDFVVADQLGRRNGRFHQHYLLAARNLARYPRKAIWEWFSSRAGFNRILPFKDGAAQYISRFIGEDVGNCYWDFRIGPTNAQTKPSVDVGRIVVAESASVSSEHFHRSSKNYRSHK